MSQLLKTYIAFMNFILDYHSLCSMLGGSAFIVSLQKNSSNRIDFSNQNCCNIFVCHICDILPCCIHAKWKQYSEIPTVVWLLVLGNAFRRSTACHKNGSICIKLISSQVINKTLHRNMWHLTKYNWFIWLTHQQIISSFDL